MLSLAKLSRDSQDDGVICAEQGKLWPSTKEKQTTLFRLLKPLQENVINPQLSGVSVSAVDIASEHFILVRVLGVHSGDAGGDVGIYLGCDKNASYVTTHYLIYQ